MKKIFIILSLTIGFNSAAQLTNGSQAPDFTLTDIDGTTHTLSTYLSQGKTVVLEFFACHCPSCWAFHNTNRLNNLLATYGPSGSSSQDIVVLAIEYDPNNGTNEFNGVSGNTQGDWVTGTNFPLINPEGTDRSILTDYSVNYYPMLYLICPNGETELLSTSTPIADIKTKSDNCTPLNVEELSYDLVIANNLIKINDHKNVEIELFNLQGELIKVSGESEIELPIDYTGVLIYKFTIKGEIITGKIVR